MNREPIQPSPGHLAPDEAIVFKIAAAHLADSGVTVKPEFLSAVTLMATALQKFAGIHQLTVLKQIDTATNDREAALRTVANALSLSPKETAKLIGRSVQ